MTKNEIVGRLKDGGLDASSTNRRAAVYVADAMDGRAVPGWFAFRIVCDSEETERRARAILSRWYDIDVNGNRVWRLKSKNRVPLAAIKRGGSPTPAGLEPLYIEAVEAGADFCIASSRNDLDIEYSTDGGQTWTAVTWTAVQFGEYVTETFTLSAVGDKVWLRGDNPQGLVPDLADGLCNIAVSAESQKQARLGGCICSLVSKTPESVTALPEYCFFGLFGYAPIVGKAASFGNVVEIGENGCYEMYQETGLTEASDMGNITTIGRYGCKRMYSGCNSLTDAADMPLLTTIGEEGCSTMYRKCYSLTAAADIPLLTTIGEGGCNGMYTTCTFAMSDDGTTLNFDFPTPPVTAGETTYATAYDVAFWMGNTNGFVTP